MDGFGGVHPFTPSGQPMPPSFSPAPYWQGWDIARGIFLLPSSTITAPVGYLLDGFGGLNGLGSPPAIKSSPYWGWDIAVGITGA
jgi:hypothetical protein